MHGQQRLTKIMADLYEEPEKPSVEQMLSIIIVQNQRIYDVLLAILGEQNEETSRRVVQVHEQMDNFGPAPFIVEEE